MAVAPLSISSVPLDPPSYRITVQFANEEDRKEVKRPESVQSYAEYDVHYVVPRRVSESVEDAIDAIAAANHYKDQEQQECLTGRVKTCCKITVIVGAMGCAAAIGYGLYYFTMNS